MHYRKQIRYFLKPKLRSPMKGTGTLEEQLVQRNLKIFIWKKKIWNGSSKTAAVEPQAAYWAFVSGFKHKANAQLGPFLTSANILENWIKLLIRNYSDPY